MSLSKLTLPVACLLVLGCQAQSFEEVTPVTVVADTQHIVVAQPVALDVMLVVDSSGSMLEPSQPGGLVSKWDELKAALLEPETGFLEANRESTRYALTSFPDGRYCEPGRLRVELGSSEGDNLAAMAAALHRIVPEGGTPTTLTLREIGSDQLPGAPGRARLVVLMTDGLPNCNAENAALCRSCNAAPATCWAPDGCRPQFSEEDECPDEVMGIPEGSSCLDDRSLVLEVERLAYEGIETVVVGFGIPVEQTGEAAQVLHAVALAGGWGRAGDKAFYEAQSSEELRLALEEAIRPASCTYDLASAPPEDGLVSVVAVDPAGGEQALVEGRDWSFRSPDRRVLAIESARCDTLRRAAEVQEVQVRWAAPLE